MTGRNDDVDDEDVRRRLETEAAAGDVRAFATLVRHWDRDLRGVAWTVLRSGTELDDVMQVVYERALRNLSRFDGRSSLKTWLHTICYRTAIDHIRQARRRPTAPFDERSLPADEADTGWQRVQLAELLSSIEPESRALLMLTAGCGYSYDEVAHITGLPRGTVASRIGRIRTKLREERLS